MSGSFPLPQQGTATDAPSVIGRWRREPGSNVIAPLDAARAIQSPLIVVKENDTVKLYPTDAGRWVTSEEEGLDVLGVVPAVTPTALGDAQFCRDYGIKYAYLSGAMANGIASVDIVTAMGKAGFLGFFGAAGLHPRQVEMAINQLKQALGDQPYGINLIHTPNELWWEEQIVDMLIAKGVRLVEASAYLNLSQAVVRYRLHGIYEDEQGRVITPNRVLAKVSRVEVAAKFLAPAPEKMVARLVAEGHLSPEQAALAKRVPVAQDLTAEADSGGHTDNRPAISLLPTLLALKDRFQDQYGPDLPLRVGLAGGIATPVSAAAAFGMGAAFVLTGSVNQACLESGTSDSVRTMLAQAGQADIAMAPAADMFEMGVQVQVLKRGTMFAMRAAKLFELYRRYDSLESLPPEERQQLENKIFRFSLKEVWQQTHAFFSERDPAQIERAERDPKHQMALVFRWYLGKSSHWANRGEADRKVDYQVWCGPAMGAFNEWVKGSWLEAPANRTVTVVAQNILYGAAVIARVNQLRLLGVPMAFPAIPPLARHELKEIFS